MTRPVFPDREPNVAAARVDRPYKFVAETKTRRDRMIELLAAIEATHIGDARMVMTKRLLDVFQDSPPVDYKSVLEDKKWRAGNATRRDSYLRGLEADDLWYNQASDVEDDMRTILLYRIFNSLDPNTKAEIVAEFKRLG